MLPSLAYCILLGVQHIWERGLPEVCLELRREERERAYELTNTSSDRDNVAQPLIIIIIIIIIIIAPRASLPAQQSV